MATISKKYTVEKPTRHNGKALKEGEILTLESFQARQLGDFVKPYKKKETIIKEDKNNGN